VRPELEQQIADMVEAGHELLFMDPRSDYDECIVGVVERFNSTFITYSRRCVLDKLRAVIRGIDDLPPDEELRESDAEEFYAFNILGAWVGDGTPAFLVDDNYGEVYVPGMVGLAETTAAGDGATEGATDGATDGATEGATLGATEAARLAAGLRDGSVLWVGTPEALGIALGEFDLLAKGLPTTTNQAPITSTIATKTATARAMDESPEGIPSLPEGMYFRLEWATGKIGRWHRVHRRSWTDRQGCTCGVSTSWMRARERVTLVISTVLPDEPACRALRAVSYPVARVRPYLPSRGPE
jgi:hypothetical protein